MGLLPGLPPLAGSGLGCTLLPHKVPARPASPASEGHPLSRALPWASLLPYLVLSSFCGSSLINTLPGPHVRVCFRGHRLLGGGFHGGDSHGFFLAALPSGSASGGSHFPLSPKEEPPPGPVLGLSSQGLWLCPWWCRLNDVPLKIQMSRSSHPVPQHVTRFGVRVCERYSSKSEITRVGPDPVGLVSLQKGEIWRETGTGGR